MDGDSSRWSGCDARMQHCEQATPAHLSLDQQKNCWGCVSSLTASLCHPERLCSRSVNLKFSNYLLFCLSRISPWTLYCVLQRGVSTVCLGGVCACIPPPPKKTPIPTGFFNLRTQSYAGSGQAKWEPASRTPGDGMTSNQHARLNQ